MDERQIGDFVSEVYQNIEYGGLKQPYIFHHWQDDFKGGVIAGYQGLVEHYDLSEPTMNKLWAEQQPYAKRIGKIPVPTTFEVQNE